MRINVQTLLAPRDGWEWTAEVAGGLLQLLFIFLWLLPLFVLAFYPERVDPVDAFAALIGTTAVFGWTVFP